MGTSHAQPAPGTPLMKYDLHRVTRTAEKQIGTESSSTKRLDCEDTAGNNNSNTEFQKASSFSDR